VGARHGATTPRDERGEVAPAPTPASAPAANGSELHRTIAEIWQTSLGVPRIGPDDSFFELGGHSLLAIRVCARIREMVGVPVSVRMLFDAPTITKLVDRIEALRWIGTPAVPVGDTPAAAREEIEL
jgi:acyl carrier protein